MAFDNSITRSGTAALQPEAAGVAGKKRPPANRHPQSGQFHPKGKTPIKGSGSKSRAGMRFVKNEIAQAGREE